MDIIDFIKEEENKGLKFLKWVEIIQSENIDYKNDALYFLEKNKNDCEAIVVDSIGNKRKIKGVSIENIQSQFSLLDASNLSEENVIKWIDKLKIINPDVNTAIVDDGLDTSVFNKEQVDSKFDKDRSRILIIENNYLAQYEKIDKLESLITAGIIGSVAPTDATPTIDGGYKPTISGTYTNCGGLIAKAKYDTTFFLKGGVWTKSETEMPEATQYIPKFEDLQFPVTGSIQCVYENNIFTLVAGQTATIADIPNGSVKWFANDSDTILLKTTFSQPIDAINSLSSANRKLGTIVRYYDTTLASYRSFLYNSNSLSGWATIGNWLEMTRSGQIYNLQGSYTLANAIAAIPSQERKSGLIITFQDSTASNRVKSYIYVLQGTGNWSNTDYWEEISQKTTVNTAIANYDKSTQLLTLKGNTSTYRMEYKTATDVDIDGDFTILLDYAFNSFPATTQYIISKGAHASTHQGYSVTALNNKILFKIKDRQISYEFDLNILNRYLFVKKGQVMSMYVNGSKVAELNTTIDLPTSNTYKFQIGLYSYNNTGLFLDGQFGNIGVINSADIDFAKIGSLLTVVDENTISWIAFLKPYLLLNTVLSTDLKKLSIQAYGTPTNYYTQRIISNGEKIYSTFSQMYSAFPEIAKVGKYTAYRNKDVKSGDILKDYDLNNNNKPLKPLKVVEKRTLVNNILSVDDFGVCYGVRNNNIIIKSDDAGVTWTDLLTVTTTNIISFIYILNNNELLLLEDTYKDDANLANDRIGGIWVTASNKTTASKVHTLSNRYQTHQPSWCIEIIDNNVYYSEYGNSYNTSTYDPSWDKGTKADAVRIWKSTDNGQTFSLLVNLNNLTDLYPANGGLHVHALHYDRHWNRLWVTTGDGGGLAKSNKKLIWTDDFTIWQGIDLSNYFNGGYQGSAMSPYENLQCLSMFSTNECLLIGADCYNNAIFRVNKRDRNKISLEVAITTSVITNDVVYFTGRMKQIDNLPILIQLGRGDSETTQGQNNQQPKILATYDGVKIMEVWSDLTTARASDFTFQFFKIKGSYYFTYSTYIVKFLM